ncbi:MAG: hypothetical protein LBF93_07985 [Zoogloeaceae bacterium]|nr:hypothetical protein [Zoogloeaceae bacterium]
MTGNKNRYEKWLDSDPLGYRKWLDPAYKRRGYFFVGAFLLFYVALALAQGATKITSGRGRWLSDLLIQLFGEYGYIGAVFLFAIFSICRGFSIKD